MFAGVSPKKVAAAIGVSESSLKRWCDRGDLPTRRTAGGHRRIPLQAAVSFIRLAGHEIVDHEMLGLPTARPTVFRSSREAAEGLRTAFQARDSEIVQGILFDSYLAGMPVGRICDEIVAPAMHALGDDWHSGAVSVLDERNACELILSALAAIRDVQIQPPSNAPLAIGCTPVGDVYDIAVTCAELTIRDTGWNTMLLGTSVSAPALEVAILENRPRLVWLSVSFVENETRFISGMRIVSDAVASVGGELALGGRALSEELLAQLRYHQHFRRFADIQQYVEASGVRAG